MAVRREWDREPSFGDALSGAGGMAEPVEVLFSTALTGDVFPDSLTTGFAGAVPATTAEPLPVATPVAAQRAPSPRAQPRPAPPRVVQAQRVPPRPVQAQRVPPRPGQAQRVPPRPVQAQRIPGQPGNRQSGYQPAPGYPSAPGYAPAPSLPGGPTYRPAAITGPPRAAGGSRPPLTVPRPTRRKGSSVSGLLFVLLIVLITSGAGQKIITAISDLLQRR